jgi:hypothetical protein
MRKKIQKIVRKREKIRNIYYLKYMRVILNKITLSRVVVGTSCFSSCCCCSSSSSFIVKPSFSLLLLLLTKKKQKNKKNKKKREINKSNDVLASGVQYCFSFPNGSLTSRICRDTLQECEGVRNDIIQQGFQPTECSKERIKSN